MTAQLDPTTDQRIACQQVIMRDGSVFSLQWMTIPIDLATGVSPDSLLQRYCAFLRRVTGGIVRPGSNADGVSFRLAGTRISLIQFLPPRPEIRNEEHSLSLAICGGVLVQARSCDRGSLTFSVAREGEVARMTLRVTEFCPLILGSNRPSLFRKWLFHLTQAYIHRMVTIRFLVNIYREMTGDKGCVRVVNAHIVDGDPI